MHSQRPTQNNSGEANPTAATPPEYDENGVDVSLVSWSLSRTPTQRLQDLQSAVDSILRLKNARKP